MRGAVRQVSIDVNYWKSFVHERLATPMGAQGCLALWGDDEKVHRLFSEHITSEYYVRTSGRGRTVDEWKLRPECTDNHWFDCLVGCAVAASMLGVSRIGHDEQPKQKTKPTKLSELRKRKRDR